ncbi:Transcription factor Dp-2 [Linnemannia schmuckeri]|uniref:Transcription factor Dp-2 n=1 Tax=Linnemannia schmuckeri TaxID=64567 RepID=A0A9P5S0E2_9FUNG|nr:Transcription factor Dp-2 [Linnemannia schmuckeri]
MTPSDRLLNQQQHPQQQHPPCSHPHVTHSPQQYHQHHQQQQQQHLPPHPQRQQQHSNNNINHPHHHQQQQQPHPEQQQQIQQHCDHDQKLQHFEQQQQQHSEQQLTYSQQQQLQQQQQQRDYTGSPHYRAARYSDSPSYHAPEGAPRSPHGINSSNSPSQSYASHPHSQHYLHFHNNNNNNSNHNQQNSTPPSSSSSSSTMSYYPHDQLPQPDYQHHSQHMPSPLSRQSESQDSSPLRDRVYSHSQPHGHYRHDLQHQHRPWEPSPERSSSSYSAPHRQEPAQGTPPSAPPPAHDHTAHPYLPQSYPSTYDSTPIQQTHNSSGHPSPLQAPSGSDRSWSSYPRSSSVLSHRHDRSLGTPIEGLAVDHIAYTQQEGIADRHYVLTSLSSSTHSVPHSRLSSHTQPSHPPSQEPASMGTLSHGTTTPTLDTTQIPLPHPESALSSPASHYHPTVPRRAPQGHEPVFMADLAHESNPKVSQKNLRIRTQWSGDRKSTGDCPPLSYQSASSQSLSADSRHSPATPRSTLPHSTLRTGSVFDNAKAPFQALPALPAHFSHPGHQLLYISESPVDYRHASHDQDDHDMEHCSEQDDVREREHEEEEDDDDDEDGQPVSKHARLDKPMDRQPIIPSPLKTKSRPAHTLREGGHGDEEEDDDDNEEGHSTFASSSSSRKPSIGGSPLREDTKSSGKARAKATPRKKAPRLPSVQAALDDAFAELDEDNHGQEGAGSQSLHGKGLGYYAPLVCDHVEARGVTTYNDVVNDLAGIPAGTLQADRADGGNPQEPAGQGNIRRRVYDALNILQALDIISMDKKEICWIGLQDARVIREASRRVSGVNLPGRTLAQQERDGADESEEPEDDDMEIEQLQKEVEAMKLKNALEMAQLQDQVARHVQLNNLIKRNKLLESKELERQERRRLRKQERGEKRVQSGDGHSKDVDEKQRVSGDEHKKRSERRHHRHSTPRPDKQGEGVEDGQVVGRMVGDETEEDIDEETARRIRKMERQERREKRNGHHASRQGTPRVDLGEDGSHDHEGANDIGEIGQPEDEEARRLRKQERRERRERKEKRAHKRQEKEAAIERANAEEGQRIQLPFVIVRIPGYAGQSSDSEANISVVRRMREDQRPRKSGKSKRHCGVTGDETTMVEVKIPHQDELSIISDTEILGDLGMNTVSLNELKEMLPEDMIPSGCFAMAAGAGARAAGEISSHEMTDSGVDVRVTVSNGYERAMNDQEG